MIIQCPSCHSEFFVERNLLNKDGRKVKCSQCGFLWFQKPEESSKQKPRFSSLDLRAGLPQEARDRKRRKKDRSSKKKNRKFIFIILMLFTFLMSYIFVFSSEEYAIRMGGFFSELWDGKKATPIIDALKREKVQIVEEKVDGEKKLVLKAQLSNVADYSFRLSMITLTFYNKENCLRSCCEIDKVVIKTSSHGRPLEVGPHSTYHLKYPLTKSLPQDAKAVVVKFGIIAKD